MLLKKIFILLFSFLTIACNKDDGCGCFDSTGKNISITKDLDDFTNINISDNINIFLIQDSVNSITLTGGENVLKGVKVYCENATFFIKNINRCNWARSYKRKINAVVRFKNLNNIIYSGTGIINTLNVLKTNNFTFDCWDGAGDISLELDTYETHINMHLGSSNIKVKGITKNNYIYTFSYGVIDCKDLFSRNVYITHRGTNNCFVYSNEQLIVNINYIGDIYYLGQPSIIETNINGTGQLIDINQ